jgi:hypothetical protein
VVLPLSLEVPAALSPGGLGMPPPWSYELESRAKQWWQDRLTIALPPQTEGGAGVRCCGHGDAALK